ncbi:twin-arginine translocase TatA/TatE family subunit [Gordonia sp. SID5947]|uniref:Sec-independent protein translocase subunit TatA n=1 Tax=Gordonia sp. SID5947 TaxID=2690315 RepID=UPI00136DAF1C|nr:Sec-independent protein translocase subunit TatA [Gordonia sp. SID5947]MYR05528.1 twin-arginine translocase TatA/TatE family subunit [Gordonia sp. SID5947]
MGALQPWHIVIVAVIFVLLFGAQKLPDAARGMGRSLRIFKSEVGELHDHDVHDVAGKALPLERTARQSTTTHDAQGQSATAARPDRTATPDESE